ncbi:hypothetical protein Catovirus_1_497 [Catovirus CTV1]|uniref:Uncharacterized protein n=1 Tax=Catovirus CTV1 TaxID=1977631 RepID=A0A1V0S9Q5_9VIRU|nr:hypothetical protein Catovirus_1_497 [Catovirus CTV1]
MSDFTVLVNIKGKIKSYPKHLICYLPLLKEYYDYSNSDPYYINFDEKLFTALLNIQDKKNTLDDFSIFELLQIWYMANKFRVRGDIYKNILGHLLPGLLCVMFLGILLFSLVCIYNRAQEEHKKRIDYRNHLLKQKRIEENLYNYLLKKQADYSTSIIPYKLFNKTANNYLRRVESKIEKEKRFRLKLNYDITKLNSKVNEFSELNDANNKMFDELLQKESLYSKSLMRESLWYNQKTRVKFLILKEMFGSKMIDYNKYQEIIGSHITKYENLSLDLVDNKECYNDTITIFFDAETSTQIFSINKPLKVTIYGEFCGVKIEKIISYNIID